MTHHSPAHHCTALPRLLLGLALASATTLASAQPHATTAPDEASTVLETHTAEAPPATLPLPELVLRSPQIGDATHDLLALQRDGRQASPTPRPIAGDVAGRSYSRYLKSFEHPIPEAFGTTVKTSSGGGK